MNEGLVLAASWTMLGGMALAVVWCVLRRTPADPADDRSDPSTTDERGRAG